MRDRWLIASWCVLLAVLMLWPVLAPGFVLSYDMVWVPDLALRRDTLGLGTELPRAVPSDAVIAALDEVIPAALLQKSVLLGSVVAGGIGAAELVPRASLTARLVAASVWVWNPFVVERLVMGHWPVLVGFAALPWIIRAAFGYRHGHGPPPSLFLLLPLGSLSAGAGLVTAAAVLAFGASRRWLRTGLLVLALAAANAPWVVAGWLHRESATTDAAGAAAFALSGEGAIPAPLAALGLGGIWNAEVVPDSRTGVLGWLWLVGLLVLVLLGCRRWWRVVGVRDRCALVACFLVGWGLAVATWALTQQMAVLYEVVPGAGLLRDGSRFLALCAPLLTTLVAAGAGVLARAAATGPPRWSVAVAMVLFPVAMLPDAAGGVSGRLAAVTYPEEYAQLRAAVPDIRGGVLVLPFTSYRAPPWNGGRKVLDPLARFLDEETLTSDDLLVSGIPIAGEDRQAAAAEDALAAGSPQARASALAELGIGLVVVDAAAQGRTPEVAGEVVHADERFRAVRLEDVEVRTPPTRWLWWMATAWSAFCGLLLLGVATGLVRCGRVRHGPIKQRAVKHIRR